MADIKVGVKRTQELAAILAASEEEDEIFKPTRTMSDEELRAANEEYDIGQSDNKSGRGMGWYVVHTYSGYEKKVKLNIEKAIENRHLENQIFEVRVPMQDVIEIKNGARKAVPKKLFPGYVLVNMLMNDDTWYVVRNTRGVTGFVGPGSKPVPLSEAEMKPLGISVSNVNVDFGVGDNVAVIAGVWKDTLGKVQKIDYNKQVATITVELFGRETPVEISFAEVRRSS